MRLVERGKTVMGFFPVAAKTWEPLPYMKRGVKFLTTHDAAALLLRPGGRKTSITLAAICELLKKGKARKILVVAPLRPCYRVWPAEVKKWSALTHSRRLALVTALRKIT